MCVLWVLAILTVVTLGFGRRVMLERRASAYSMDYAQAKQMARGAIEVGRVKLANQDALTRSS